MSVRLGADYMTRVSPSVLHSMGVTFVSRYHSDFPSKNLTHAEAKELSDNNIDVVSNWENDINDFAGGYNAGVRNANAAAAQQSACGGAGHPIYFSVDTDVAPSRVADYFRGIVAAIGVARSGVYGSTAICRYLKQQGLVKYTWRTMSTGWTGGAGDPSEFNVEQTGYFNQNMDRDASITDDFGQWRVGNAAPPAPNTNPGDDLPTPQDVWAYKGANDNEDMRQYLVDAVAAIKNVPYSVWAYSHGDLPDVHQTLDTLRDDVKSLRAEVAALKASPGGIDVNALAVALAAHLKLSAQ